MLNVGDNTALVRLLPLKEHGKLGGLHGSVVSAPRSYPVSPLTLLVVLLQFFQHSQERFGQNLSSLLLSSDFSNTSSPQGRVLEKSSEQTSLGPKTHFLEFSTKNGHLGEVASFPNPTKRCGQDPHPPI